MSSPLVVADAYAREVLRRLDHAELDEERTALLRPSFEGLRLRLAGAWALRAEARRFPLLLLSLGSLTAVGAWATADLLPDDEPIMPGFVWFLLAIAVVRVLSPALRWRSAVPAHAEPDDEIPALLDGLVAHTRGTVDCYTDGDAARARSLGHGGPVSPDVELPHLPRRRSRAERAAGGRVERTVDGAHDLLRSTTDPPLLARYSRAHLCVWAAAEILRGKPPRGVRVRRVAMFAALAVSSLLLLEGIPLPWRLLAAFAAMSAVWCALSFPKRYCWGHRRSPWDPARVTAAVDAHLTDVARLPGEPPAHAVALLAEARELLDRP